ncbi:hypothetical protein [Shinella sedimenti]|uniref:Uncharacterized protein n=1 Tax=Shinella sedimenti TaxID=2919913 RepID=A0ABT0CJH1_9HYPH|nr:hypothetical protein [Shinella sedimenti]MCJ8148770.1 hypothetical protein [Shinella sedimenti]
MKNVSFSGFDYNRFINLFPGTKPAEKIEETSMMTVFPYFSQGKIRIELSIPFRLQDKYCGMFREKLKSENVTLVINYNNHLPCTFVYTEDLEDRPSTAVMIVWKHFKNVLKKSNDIKFTMLGPSPFHAEFYVNSAPDAEFHLEYKKESGYDRVNILVDEKKEIERSRDFIEYTLREEAGLFYEVVKKRNETNQKTTELYSKIEKLSKENEGAISKIKNFIKFERLNTYDCLIELEKNQLSIDEFRMNFSEDIEIIELRTGKSHLLHKINQEVDKITKTPLISFKNILSTIKDRHNLTSTNRAVITSTIVGVLCGYAMTSLPAIFATIAKIIDSVLQRMP